MTHRNLPALFFFVAAASLALVPVQAGAAALVNINTADSATLQTLTGIGPSKAQAIIDYRTQHGPFAAKEEIMNVSGIGTATFNNIKDSITVEASGQPAEQSSAPTQTQSVAETQTASPSEAQVQTSGGMGPPPISAQMKTDAVAVVGAGTRFEGSAFGTKGEPLSGARYVWNFGDGTTGEGQKVVHTFAYPGTYDVQLSVGYNYSSATAQLMVPAIEAAVFLVAEGDGSLTVGNRTGRDLTIGQWSVVQGTSSFYVPADTVLLAGMGVRFAPAVLGFSGDSSATLRYANGSFAASAAVGDKSPLRGEAVALEPASAGSAPASAALSAPRAQAASKTKTAQKSANEAAAAAAEIPEVAWSYLLGLTAVIAIGAVGAYYASIKPEGSETSLSADEFDIE